jgi:hypothetical protein
MWLFVVPHKQDAQITQPRRPMSTRLPDGDTAEVTPVATGVSPTPLAFTTEELIQPQELTL